MSETMRARKWWWGWEPEKIENWLEEMEAQGWHVDYGMGIGTTFQFTRGEPRKVRYCADYQNKVTPEYSRIFHDVGWELVYSGMGWYIWGMPYETERPEIYTDMEATIERNNRLMLMLAVICMLQLPVISSLISSVYSDKSVLPFILGLYGGLFSFMAYCFYHLMESTNRLKARKRNI